jgi:hypothetical protein
MKKRINIFLLLIIVSRVSLAQNTDWRRDNNWLFGYGSSTSEPPFGWTTLDFSGDSVNSIYQPRFIDLFEDNASICDTNGKLLFYTNGVKIANADNQLMLNGDGLNPGIFTTGYPSGLIIPQGALALPIPGSDSLCVLIHGYMNVYEDPVDPLVCMSNLYYSRIDMRKGNGLGAVIEKNFGLMNDTLALGKITAVRHGNGRDWWVVVPEKNTNCYYSYLLTPEGFSGWKQCIGDAVTDGLGQAFFSPDGTKYARNDLIGGYLVKDLLNIYDFDRCSGLLSNQYQLEYADSALSGGIAFSPNSRYLYVSHYAYIFQFDLKAADIEKSMTTVAVYDGFTSPAATRFYLAHLAPDNKIYICSPNGVNYLHVIEKPDEPGLACNVVQHGLELPAYSLTMPNFANFRLGKWEGSPCDTIGLNNAETVISFSKVFVYPNPASDFVIVDNRLPVGDKLDFILFDATGRKILVEKTESGENRIELSGYKSGIYFFKIEAEGRLIKAGKLLITNTD